MTGLAGLGAFSGGLDPATLALLLATSLFSSFVTASLGIGGGVLLLAVMASLLPPAALIPVHGVIQFGSNAGRAAILWRHVHWPPFAAFTTGTVVGIALGGVLAVDLPPPVIRIGVGLFVIWSVFATPPAGFGRLAALNGGIASFLTMFFGATGPFVATYVKALTLPRQAHVATHAVLMTLQHGAKIVAFGVLGFAFAPWAGFVFAMILSGLAGTLLGRRVLLRMTDTGFKRALDIVLVLLSLRLIWTGARALAGV